MTTEYDYITLRNDMISVINRIRGEECQNIWHGFAGGHVKTMRTAGESREQILRWLAAQIAIEGATHL